MEKFIIRIALFKVSRYADRVMLDVRSIKDQGSFDLKTILEV